MSNNLFATTSDQATTTLPGFVDMKALLPELTTPQERYDHGFQRGYMAGYAEGARQAQAERAADLASQKTNWAAAQARASAVLGQLASATDEYVARFGPRDTAITEELISAAFELAETVVACELRTRPERALEVARAVLNTLPTGPAIVRVNPGDEALVLGAAGALGDNRSAVAVIADPAVGPGGCIVSSGAKTIDARIEAALERAGSALCAPVEPADRDAEAVAGYRADKAVAGYRAVVAL